MIKTAEMIKLREITETLSYKNDVVNSNNTRLTVHDIELLTDIVSKLQHINNESLAKSLLKELDTLLGISGSVLGVYNPESNENEYSVTTIPVDRLSEYNHNPLSMDRNSPSYYEYRDGKYCSFLYLECRGVRLQNRQQEILKIILPYIFASTIRLYLITRQLMVFDLTSRELEVMQWIIAGKDNWSISKILGVSERTVKFHNCNIYKKLGVNTKAEAISLYLGLMSRKLHTL